MKQKRHRLAKPTKKLSIAASLALLVLAGCVAGPIYEGDALKNFDGNVFFNSERLSQKPLDMVSLGWGMVTKAEQWPTWIDDNQPEPIPKRVKDGLRVTYINHATTLIQMDGINILTDPIYSDRASPFSWAGPKRVRAPGIPLNQLPEIDVILISHNHYDHLDVDTLQKIQAQQDKAPRILAGLGNGELFEEIGMKDYLDMQWNQTDEFEGIRFSFVECRHRSGRGLADQMKTLWGSFVIESDTGSVYFAGDTGYGPHLKEHGDQFGPFDLTILPIGAYEPRWFMADVHVNPAEAVQAHNDLKSQKSLSIHFGIFQLTYEAVDAPAKDLNTALRDQALSQDTFMTLQPGQSRVLKGNHRE